VTTTKAWLEIALICGLGVVANMCTGEIGPLVAELQTGLQSTTQGVGAAAGMQFLPFLLGGTLVGRAIERAGSRCVVIFGLLVLLSADVSNLFATTLAWFALNTVAQGTGMLSVLVASQVAVADKFKGRSQATALSAWSVVPVIGNALGMLLSSGLSSPSMWRATYAVHASLVTLLGALGLLALAAPSHPRTEGQAEHRIRKGLALRRERSVLRVSVGFAAAGLTFTGSAAAWPMYLSKAHHSTLESIGSLAAIAMLFGIAGSAAVGSLISRDYSSRRVVLGIAAAAIASTVILYTGAGGLYVMTLAMVIWSLATGAMVTFTFAMLPRFVRDPRNTGAATGVLYQLGCVGALLGAPVFLAIASWNHAAFLLCAVVVVCFACMAALFPVWGSDT
jgi:MFS family permease